MKGAAIGHAKQRIEHGRYIGITEPGIIAAEPPNPIVNQLAILPDIEKRLEAFVRLAHGIVVFPGRRRHGRGDPLSRRHPARSGQSRAALSRRAHRPAGERGVFRAHQPLHRAARSGARRRGASRVIIDDPPEVARHMVRGMDAVREFRRQHSDSYNFNWLLSIRREFQQPFEVTHAVDAGARAAAARSPPHQLAANLRRAFSGIVTGNVKEYGIQAIERDGPYELAGDPAIMRLLDELLAAFVAQRRMRLPGSAYRPVYRLVA